MAITAMCACGKPLSEETLKHYRDMGRELQIWIKHNNPTPDEIIRFMDEQYDRKKETNN